MESGSDNVGLHERRRRLAESSSVNFSQIRRPRPSVRTDIDEPISTTCAAQRTPPETPMSPEGDGQMRAEQQSLFHNYLRAFCHFVPPSKDEATDEGLLMTAAIRPGDLILVHSIHENGWADGTVLTTGARGWLPTNYCESFDHPHMRHLLNAMTQFWDLLCAPEDATLSTFVRQDYVKGLIAGVRYLLEQSNCLHREANLVQRHAGIRRMRKGLLADLATLVQIAKNLQETMSASYAGEVAHVLLDDLLAKAFKVVTRAVGFVDMLAQETIGTLAKRSSRPQAYKPSGARARSTSLAIHISTSDNKTVTRTIDSAIDFQPLALVESPQARPLVSHQIDDSSQEPHSPISKPTSVVLAHRFSVVQPQRSKTGTLASDRLATAHDECIGQIGVCVGLYLRPRSSLELLSKTDRLVQACENLLEIVDQVISSDSHQNRLIEHARASFVEKLDELNRSTNDVFKFSDSPDDDIVMLPEQTNLLVRVGTNLVAIAGDVVAQTRKLIEQLGDFDIQRPSPETIPETAGDHAVDDEQQNAEAGAQDQSKDENKQEPAQTAIVERRLSSKPLPAPPMLRDRATTSTGLMTLAPHSPRSIESSPLSPFPSISHSSLPPLRRLTNRSSADSVSNADGLKSPAAPIRSNSISPARKCSVGASISGSTDTRQSSLRDSAITTVSEVSTRATTPDRTKDPIGSRQVGLMTSFGSVTSLRSAAGTDASSDVENMLLQKTYANELMHNKDGQVIGGSLPALVEKLTPHDTAPDPQFVSAFFITFRSFTTPRELAEALMHRFEYVGDSKNIGMPVRLRIYNVFKGWLETYWRADADRDALGDIRYFALHKLRPHIGQAGERLVDLTRKVTSGYCNGTITGQLVSGVGKISTSIGSQYAHETNVPDSTITKSQLNALRNATITCYVTDFDALEIARQLTILTSHTFCQIQADELLSLDWSTKGTTLAPNVRQMCALNTDLTNVIGDTIVGPDDAKKRAVVIKHWSKIAKCCLDLSNYDSLMAIMCSLNSALVQRLKQTWAMVSKKTKARLDELTQITDVSRNYLSLRSRLEKPVAPCLPFLGVYLTDLTFVDAGNPKTRELPGVTSESGEPVSVINFDKHMRVAKIIGHLQKFQVAYKLKEVPEMQVWMHSHLDRMREGNTGTVAHLHRRSLVIEPKDLKAIKLAETRQHPEPELPEDRPKTAGSVKTTRTAKTVQTKADGLKFEVFWRTNVSFKPRTDLGAPDGVSEQK